LAQALELGFATFWVAEEIARALLE